MFPVSVFKVDYVCKWMCPWLSYLKSFHEQTQCAVIENREIISSLQVGLL